MALVKDGVSEVTAVGLVAQALLDRFVERSYARTLGGAPTFRKGTKMAELPSSYSDDFYKDAEAVLAALLTAQPNESTDRSLSRLAQALVAIALCPDTVSLKDIREKAKAALYDFPATASFDATARMDREAIRTVREVLIGREFHWCLVDVIPASETIIKNFGKDRQAAESALAAPPPTARADREAIQRIKDRIDTRMNDVLCEMKPDWDDSMVGFNEAWDIARAVFKDELEKATQQPKQRGETEGLRDAIKQYSRDLRRNSSGGDDYPWEIMRGVADQLDRMLGWDSNQTGARE